MIVEPDVVTSSVRNVSFLDSSQKVELVDNGRDLKAGDVVAVEIVEKGGSYGSAEVKGAEMVDLGIGDIVVGVLGRRKATRGFSAEMPYKLEEGEELDFVSSGGVFAKGLSYPEDIGRPYRCKFLGFVSKDGRRINISEYSLDPAETIDINCPLVMVASSRMDAGKTTVCKGLITKFVEQGKTVGAVKLTGVTRERDTHGMKKAGAKKAYEFTDCGLPSSTCEPDIAIRASKGLINEAGDGVDVVVAELGAGLLSSYNVLEVLKDKDVKKACTSLVFMAMDPVGAYGGLRILEDHGYSPDVISGPATDTEAGRENIRRFTDIPVKNAIKNIDGIFETVKNRCFNQ